MSMPSIAAGAPRDRTWAWVGGTALALAAWVAAYRQLVPVSD